MAQQGAVVSKSGQQILVRLSEEYMVRAPDIGYSRVPDSPLISAQMMVTSVQGSLANCTLMMESVTAPPQEGHPVWFGEPVQQEEVRITSDPVGAAIAINGARVGRTPATLLLEEGRAHAIVLSRTGFETDSTLVFVQADERKEHHVALLAVGEGPVTPPPGQAVRLAFTSTPGRSSIHINGQPYGLTPMNGMAARPLDLSADSMLVVEISQSKFRSQIDTLRVEPGQVWQEHYTLEEKLSPFSVLVYPWGSDVIVDGERVGETPFAGELPWGYHTVRVERPGFVPLALDEVFIWGITDQNDAPMIEVVEGTLQRNLGWIHIRSAPRNTHIRLSDVPVGVTPLDLRVPPGTYEVVFEDGGTGVYQESVEVMMQDTVEVAYTTTPDGPNPVAELPAPSPPLLPPTPEEPRGEAGPAQAQALDENLPPLPANPTSVAVSPAVDRLAQGRALTQDGAYERARTTLLEAQSFAPENMEIAEAIGEVTAVLEWVRALSSREREDVAILRRTIRETALTRDYRSLQLAAQRLFEYIPHDPATLAALQRGFARAETPGNGPVLRFVYVFGEAEHGAEEDALSEIEPAPFNGFLLTTTEITNAQFAEFLNRQDHQSDREGRRYLAGSPLDLVEDRQQGWRAVEGKEQHPVVDASWYGANAYAEWVGGRLPTEAEWRWAYTVGLLVANDLPGVNMWQGSVESMGAPRAVSTGTPDGLGLHDMAGNVWEWTEDASRGRSRDRTILGGSFRSRMRDRYEILSALLPADFDSKEVGFRVLRTVE